MKKRIIKIKNKDEKIPENYLHIINNYYISKEKKVRPEEVAQQIYPLSYLSSYYMLDYYGLLNNPYNKITSCILENSIKETLEIKENGYHFIFYPPDKSTKTQKNDAKELFFITPYLMAARPEKAFLDALCLAKNGECSPPSTDIDMESLDKNKITRMAKKNGLEKEWNEWKSKYLKTETENKKRKSYF